MAINPKLLAKVQAKMAAKAEKKNNKGGGKEGYLNLTDDVAKTDKKGVFVNEVRVLPTSLDPVENDFLKEVSIHYGIGKTPFVCPKETFGKDCDACDSQSDLWDVVRATEAKKGDKAYELAKTFYATQRFYSPVVRRAKGKTLEGALPVWYGYNEKKQEEIMAWLMDEDIGDITDPMTGRDLRIVKKTKEADGSDYGSVKQELHPKGVTKLGTKEEVEALIEQIPDLMSLMEVWDNEKIKEVVAQFLADQVGDDVETSETKYGKDSEKTDDVSDVFKDLKEE